MKILINTSHGGFGFSDKVYEELISIGWSVFETESFIAVESDAKIFKRTRNKPKEKPWYGDGDNYCFQYKMIEEGVRLNPDIIAIVEKLGTEANTHYSNIKVVEIPDDVDWEIVDYDGAEWIAEKHRTWR